MSQFQYTLEDRELSISGSNVVTNTGDINASDDITINTPAGGDLTGFYPSPTVASLSGFPLSNAAPNSGEVLTWNGTQWIPSSSTNTYSAGTGLALTGTTFFNTGDTNASDDITITTIAGGDASGVFSNLTVSGIQGNPFSVIAPSSAGQVWKWDGFQWIPAADANTTYSAGTGLSLSGTTFINTGDTDASDDITNTTTAGGDLSGTYPSPTVTAIQGTPVANSAPTIVGQTLIWDGNQWIPATISPLWSASGNDISYSTGNVGVKTSSPTSELSVNGTSTVVNALDEVRVESGVINDEGFVNIYDSNNALKAGLRINGLGQGEIFGDVKNFRIDHPEKPNHEIWYASLEGPEAAAYVRGTATLVDGKVDVEFDKHFQLISNSENMTVILTPLSADSKGLAVIEKTDNGFEVKELFAGKGNYSFDWEVKCVRRGHENFRVIREKR